MEASWSLGLLALGVMSLVQRGSAEPPESLVHQAVRDALAACHLVLMVTMPHSLLLTTYHRQATRSFVVMSASVEPRRLFHALTRDSTTTCRGLIIHLDASTTATTNILRLLEQAELWKLPETRLVVLGSRIGVKTVLLHHSFRNTVHGLYLALHHQANATQHRRRLKPGIADATAKKSLRQEASVYRRCLYCNEGSAGVERVGKLPSLGSPFNLLFLDKDEHFRSLNGHQLNLVTTRYIPYVDFKRHTEQPNTPVTLTSSLDAHNLSTLSKILNFTYVVRKEPEASWGRYIDGNFTGMMGQLQREEVDLCTLCAITPERNQAINFLQVYPSDTITLVSLKPSYLSRHFLLVRPFTGIVWSGVVVAVVLWGSAMATFGWLLRREVQMRPVDYNAPFLLGWGALLEQSVAYQPVNVSRRVLVSVWLTFSLIVVSAYKSSLIANLSIQGKVDTPQTLRELTEAQGWEWATEDWVFRGYPYEYFSKHQHPIVKMVFQQIQIMPADETLKKVMKGRFSAFNYEKFITIYIKAHFTDALGRSPFQISKKPTSYVAAYGWGMRRGSPFYARFHQLVGRLRDAGIIAYWTEKETDRHTEKGTEEPFTYDSSGEYSKDRSKQVVLGLSQLDGAFYVYVLGIGVSFLIFLLEVITG